MKITFTTSEIIDWLEALQNHFCTDSEEAIEQYDMLTKKLKNAEIRSKASIGKIRAIHRAEDKKLRERDAKVRDNILELINQKS